MSEKLHLVCNAHIDPVWQWEWEEGAAETLSTFRIAADFCEKFDRFVFCHNEALLYRWIEEYDIGLFKRIEALVKAKKWHIMGGWHLQPDCNMPSGELMVRQIAEGRQYFLEKFGVAPSVAVNLDPFGHSRGLVQILKKTGYTGYLFMRPWNNSVFSLPASDFKWVGYDGSEITAVRISGGYGSDKGEAANKILSMIESCPDDDFSICLWGVGNHGGGPSLKDLEDIEILTEKVAKDGVTLIHSTPEAYVDEVSAKRDLPRFEGGLNPWAVGCYTSQVRIKQTYRKAENMFLMTEIMSTHAESAGLMAYPEKELAEALYDILTVQFHDMLPGSSVQSAEELSLRMLDHAIEILSRVRARAFFALSKGQKKASEDKIPVFAYNPYPYPVEGDFHCEFMLWDQYRGEKFKMPQIYDENGNALPTQCEKENSSLPIEWRKRVVFHTTLAPMSLNRFDCAFSDLDERPARVCPANDTHYLWDSESLHIEINRKTGLIDTYRKDGIDYLRSGALALEVWNDNFDPWYMKKHVWTEKIGEFTLVSPEETAAFCALPEPIPAVHVIEHGAVRTVIEAVFGYERSRAVVRYLLSEKEGLSVQIRVQWNEKQKMIKWNVPVAMEKALCLGEHMYGREVLHGDLTENVSQTYLALCDAENTLSVINDGVYGSSYDAEASALKITLLRSPGYTAHPIGDRKVLPVDRFMPHIDQGEREYAFAIDAGSRKDILSHVARKAQHFNMAPMTLSFYPEGRGEKPVPPVTLTEDSPVTMHAFKKADDKKGYIVRLFNPTERVQRAKITILGKTQIFLFSPFEIKTIRVHDGGYEENDLLEDLLTKCK